MNRTPVSSLSKRASGTGLTLNLRGLEPSQEPLAVTSRGSAPGPSWAHLARVFWPQYACLAALIVVLILTERVVPFRHVLYSHSDEELWKLSYPLRTNHVPAWAVPTIAVLAPLSAIFGWHFTGKISALEAHHAAFAALTCLAANGLATNLIKVSVGRFRPNFAARCWPNGALPRFDDQGRPACMDNAVDPAEGMKSFPSGHTSWSTAGLGFLSLWLMGPGLRCFEGRHDGPLRLVVALAPLAGAAWIGASRLQDYWHHVEDVVAGFTLGLVMAIAFYHTQYPPVFSRRAPFLKAALSNTPTGGSGFSHISPLKWPSTNVGGVAGLELQPADGDSKV